MLGRLGWGWGTLGGGKEKGGRGGGARFEWGRRGMGGEGETTGEKNGCEEGRGVKRGEG